MAIVLAVAPARSDEPDAERAMVMLPTPAEEGARSLEEVIARRRSRRDLAPTPLTSEQIGQLCWAAQGITGEGGHRAAPSAGATYPLELHVATSEGLFRYDPSRHSLHRMQSRDVREALRDAALGQEVVGDAPVVLVLSGVVARTARRYGDRAERYVHFEAGHAAQNVLLEAEALGLGAVPIGAFDDVAVSRAAEVERGATPLYLIPVGRAR